MPQVVIDSLNSAAGWTTSTNAQVVETDVPAFRMDDIVGQLRFTLPAGEWAEKEFAQDVDVSAFTDLAIQIVSHNPPKSAFEDFRLLITFTAADDSTLPYYLPCVRGPAIIRLDRAGLADVKKIRIEALQDQEVILTGLIAFLNVFPLDFYSAVSKIFARHPIALAGCGFITGSPTAKNYKVSSPSRYEEGSVVTFGGETHQIKGFDNETVRFSSMFDGQKMLGTFTDEPMYIAVPVLIEPGQHEEIRPAIMIHSGWGMTDNAEESTHDELRDSFRPDGGYRPRLQQIEDFALICRGLFNHSEEQETIEFVFREIQRTEHFIWINGERIEINISAVEPAAMQNPEDAVDETHIRIEFGGDFGLWEKALYGPLTEISQEVMTEVTV